MADKKNDKYLSLYPEDFISMELWDEICEQLDVDNKCREVRIYFASGDVVTLGNSNTLSH